MVTVAPETTAPVGSWIVPATAVKSDCAKLAAAKKNKRNEVVRNRDNLLANFVPIDSLDFWRGEKTSREMRKLMPLPHPCITVRRLYNLLEEMQMFSGGLPLNVCDDKGRTGIPWPARFKQYKAG